MTPVGTVDLSKLVATATKKAATAATAKKPVASQTLSSPLLNGDFETVLRQCSYTGYNPTPFDRARFLILGLRKNWKTSFAASSPTTIVLDWEGGANSVMYPRARIVNLSDMPVFDESDPRHADELRWLAIPRTQRFHSIRDFLLANARNPKNPFKRVAIDTIDRMAEHYELEFLQENDITHLNDYKRSKGAGYSELAKRVRNELFMLEQAGYGMTYNAHLIEKRFEGEGGRIFERPIPRMYDSLYTQMMMLVESIIRVSLLKVTDQERIVVNIGGIETETLGEKSERVVISLNTMPSPGCKELGCRVQIPDGIELPMESAWETLRTAYNEEVERVRKLTV